MFLTGLKEYSSSDYGDYSPLLKRRKLSQTDELFIYNHNYNLPSNSSPSITTEHQMPYLELPPANYALTEWTLVTPVNSPEANACLNESELETRTRKYLIHAITHIRDLKAKKAQQACSNIFELYQTNNIDPSNSLEKIKQLIHSHTGDEHEQNQLNRMMSISFERRC